MHIHTNYITIKYIRKTCVSADIESPVHVKQMIKWANILLHCLPPIFLACAIRSLLVLSSFLPFLVTCSRFPLYQSFLFYFSFLLPVSTLHHIFWSISIIIIALSRLFSSFFLRPLPFPSSCSLAFSLLGLPNGLKRPHLRGKENSCVVIHYRWGRNEGRRGGYLKGTKEEEGRELGLWKGNKEPGEAIYEKKKSASRCS